MGFSADGRYLVALAGRANGLSPLYSTPEACESNTSAARIAQSIQSLGLQQTLELIDGSFCLAILDRRLHTLSLVRDRIGQCSLYYGWTHQGLVFASELKAIASSHGFSNLLDRNALTLLLRYGYIPSPYSIHRGIFKLAAGTIQVFSTLDVERGAPHHDPSEGARYWHPKRNVSNLIQAREHVTEERAISRLQDALSMAVDRVSDRKTGSFLSGGTDSSLITSLLQSQRSTPVDTVTIGFEDADHDEMDWAQKVASHLGTRHFQQRISDQQAVAILPEISEAFCEPFADSSQIPTLLAAGSARRQVSHMLTGDGGDELFFGHAAYARALRNARLASMIPDTLRCSLRRRGVYTKESARLGGWRAALGETISRSVEDSYLLRVSRWRNPHCAVLGSMEYPTIYDTPMEQLTVGSPGERVLFMDIAMELGEGLMTKVDRACMLHGLNTSSPFLDQQVFQLAWQIPLKLKMVRGEQKYILKRLLELYLPQELIYRPKRGFGAPVGRWLRGPLREWAEDLLTPSKLEEQDVFDVGVVTHLWQAFIAGQRKWHTHLWPILMFQAWQQRWQQQPSFCVDEACHRDPEGISHLTIEAFV
ncbi:asparagine synthase-related protein [Xanthomonas axonopodis]|uniref:asparagine synthase-related protein n=1 Tax=Xanthomonas axonopodis TaxID=53413 RepID=UPI003556805B